MTTSCPSVVARVTDHFHEVARCTHIIYGEDVIIESWACLLRVMCHSLDTVRHSRA